MVKKKKEEELLKNEIDIMRRHITRMQNIQEDTSGIYIKRSKLSVDELVSIIEPIKAIKNK